MSNYTGRSQRRLRRSSMYMVLLYLLILAVIAVGGFLWEKSEQEHTFGSLEGRFDSDIVLTNGLDSVNYRENEITNYLCIVMDREGLRLTGAQADIMLMLSVDRRYRTVTPVLIDCDLMTEAPACDTIGARSVMRLSQAQVSGIGHVVETVSGLLKGVVVDRWLLTDKIGAGQAISLLAGRESQDDLLNGELSGHVASSVPLSTLYSESAAFENYEWKPLRSLPYEYRRDENGRIHLFPDEQALREMVIEIWFD